MAYDYGDYWRATSYEDYAAASNLEGRLGVILPFLEREGVGSLLEVGAGPGAIAAQAGASGIRAVAADVASAFLPQMVGRAMRATIDALPVGAGAVEAVVASEVLEHLSEPILERAVAELQRVASRWVVITVPHREQLEYEQLECSSCRGHFNGSGHLRELGEDVVRGWFPNHRLHHVEPIGERRRLPRGLGPLMRVLGGATNPSWEAGQVSCPMCGSMVRLSTPGDSWRAWAVLRVRGILWHVGKRVPGQMMYVFACDVAEHPQAASRSTSSA